MPLQLRTTTLSTAVCAEGVRCYTKTVDGEVREACDDTSDAAIAQSVNAKDTGALESREGWYPGALKFHCSPDSSLCTFAWAAWHQSIFYQSEDYVLREKRRSPASSCEWVDTDFAQDGCMPGTNLAVVHSADAERIVILWQDKEGWLCYRKAQGWVWDEETTRLCKAIDGTGIGAASWNDLVDMRVYYQDDYHVIREYRGGFESTWKLVEGFTIKSNSPVGDITAISWKGPNDNVEVRLYLQDDNDDIIEWCNSGKGWYSGQYKQPALPEADITAFVRHVQSDTPGYLITVMWTGQDQMLYQQVYSDALQAWLQPARVTDLQNAGTSVGVWVGEHFSDNCPGIDAKAVRSITVSADDALCGLSIAYGDGTETLWRGAKGGRRHQFALAAGEDITQVFVAWSETSVEGLQFITSKGCESPWYGKQSATPLLWEYKGHPLAGFIGTVGGRINGLKPFWASRASSTSLLTIDENIVLSTRIGKDIAHSAARIDALAARTAAYTRAVEQGLAPPALAAMRGVAQLVAAVEYLHELALLSKAARAAGKPEVAYRALDVKTNVGRCQGEAAKIEGLLRDLATAANKLVPEGEQISRAVAQEIDSAKLRSDKLSTIKASAEGLKVMAEAKKRELTAARDKVDKDMREARRQQAQAQEQRDTKAGYKWVRDVVTLGIGNRYDMFNLNKNIASINETIAAKKAALEAARARLDAITSDIAKVAADLRRIDDLAAATTSQQGTLGGVLNAMDGLLAQNKDVAGAATGLSSLLNQMHASSEDLDDQSTADAFARGVLKIGGLAYSSVWLTGLMGERGAVLRDTVERIAGAVEEAPSC